MAYITDIIELYEELLQSLKQNGGALEFVK